ncbi:hypothetical protein GCM10025794_32880 [Massilia kyonggiensis]
MGIKGIDSRDGGRESVSMEEGIEGELGERSRGKGIERTGRQGSHRVSLGVSSVKSVSPVLFLVESLFSFPADAPGADDPPVR